MQRSAFLATLDTRGGINTCLYARPGGGATNGSRICSVLWFAIGLRVGLSIFLHMNTCCMQDSWRHSACKLVPLPYVHTHEMAPVHTDVQLPVFILQKH